SGATGTTSLLNSSTRRVPDGDAHVRMPVSWTPLEEGSAPWARAGPGQRAAAESAAAAEMAARPEASPLLDGRPDGRPWGRLSAPSDRRTCDMSSLLLPAVHGVTGGDWSPPPARVVDLLLPNASLVQLQRLEPRGAVPVDDQHERLAGLAHLGHLRA